MLQTIPPGEHVPTADQRVVLRDASWEAYETLLSIRGERAQPRIAYLDGALELMTTSAEHEQIKKRIAITIETYLLDHDIAFEAFGQFTMKRDRALRAGLEADECYVIGEVSRGADPRPDLAIEVVWTSGGIDKLEIYRRLGVREVWFWQDGELRVFELADGSYARREHSAVLPGLSPALVSRVVALPSVNEAVRALRAALATS